MTKEIINNLEILRAAVEAQPENLFDLESFKSVAPCGTLFCTLGLACTMTHFQKMGFSLEQDGYEDGWYDAMLNSKSAYSTGLDINGINSVFGAKSFNRLFEPAGGGSNDRELGFDINNFSGMTHKTLALNRLDRQINIYKGEQA